MKHLQYLKGFMRRRGLPVVIVVIAIGGVLGLTQLRSKDRQAQPVAPPPVAVQVMDIVPLTRANAGANAGMLRDSFVLTGHVTPNTTVTVSSELAATVQQLPHEKGSLVKKGDLLAVLNKDLAAPALASAQASEKSAKRDLDRLRELFKRNAAKPSEVDDAQTKYDLAKAGLETAQANFKRTEIYAPCGGILDERPVEVGQLASPGTPIAKIVDIDTVKVAVDVPERDIASLKAADSVDVLIGYSGENTDAGMSVRGKISFISVQACPVAHTTPIEISANNAVNPSTGKRPLYTNQRVDVRLTRSELSSLVTIPLDAIIPLESSKVVYVVKNGKARERQVQMGSIRGSSVQILAGLGLGDRLIVDGQRSVSDGQPVSVVSGAQRKDAPAAASGENASASDAAAGQGQNLPKGRKSAQVVAR